MIHHPPLSTPPPGGHALLLGTGAGFGRSQAGRSPVLVHLQQAGRGAHAGGAGGQAGGRRLGQQQSRGAHLHRRGDDRHPGAIRTGRAERQHRHRPIGVRGLEQRMFTKTLSTPPPRHG